MLSDQDSPPLFWENQPTDRRFDLDPGEAIPYSPVMIRNTCEYSAGKLAVLAVLFVLSFWEARACDQESQIQAEPREGVLVLHNGQVFQGKITQAGDRHIVALGGGQISIKSSDVEVCCSSLEEAYQFRKRYSPCQCALDHIQLAQWCQRQGLLESASRELAEAKRLDSLHPMIPLLERRLQAMREGVEPRQPIAMTAIHREPEDELDHLVRKLPSGTMESFTQTIQPMLMNHCMTSGCHGPGASKTFSLTRVSAGGVTSRRITQRNLQTVLQWIDRNKPEASPLLAIPLRAHGNAKGPIFTDRQTAQYQQLQDWVYRVAQMPAPTQAVMQASHVEQNKTIHRATSAVYTTPAAQVLSGAQTLGGDERAFPEMSSPTENLQGQTSITAPPLDASLPQTVSSRFDRPGVKRGELPKKFTPADPFDPQIFNRQFFPGKSGATNSEPPQ